jgi:2-dehydro-3-deoxyphosphogluconate aldolase/(4S)-4-hydroxy-2-oxoglutarate aldolase
MIDEVETAVPLVRALVTGGLSAVEITLRTRVALQAIERVVGEVEGVIVGAGTVLDEEQWQGAVCAGSRFIVSPGSTESLLDLAEDSPIPFLPAAATASEAMLLRDRGYRIMKFFPAEPAGGIAYLQALEAPLSELMFCPTGGINAHNFKSYLALPNVICVGGSWLAPKPLVQASDWGAISALARQASL